jgi:glycosyltransferase involved in cell wall biosynthesis
VVIPSRSEGMPNVLLEAAWFRVPVVASRVGGIPDMMNGGLSEFLFASEDYERLAQLMESIVEKSDKEREEIGAALHNRLKASYMASSRTKKVHRLYRALFRKRYGR